MVDHVFGVGVGKSGMPSFSELEGIPVCVCTNTDVRVEMDSYEMNGQLTSANVAAADVIGKVLPFGRASSARDMKVAFRVLVAATTFSLGGDGEVFS